MTVPPVLDPEDVSLVIQRYQRRIAEHGATFASLNSGSEEKQAIRQWVHASALRGDRPSILEIGCGLGDFYKYLVGTEAGLLLLRVRYCSRVHRGVSPQLSSFEV